MSAPLDRADGLDLNAGNRTMTSDNAIVVAPGIEGSAGWTATVSGGRVRTWAGGLRVIPDETLPSPKIAPPGDLHLPLMASPIDAEYADAVWESITRGNDAARRVARAIDWLDVAWLNATGLTDDLRIPALRAGFEVLFDSDDSAVVRDEFCAICDTPNAPRLPGNGAPRKLKSPDLRI